MKNQKPSEIMAQWRSLNWPPVGLEQYQNPKLDINGPRLNIYWGDHDTVSAFGEKLADAMPGLADHIVEKCRGRKPRWMAIPKIMFGVTRLNITESDAKASQTFTSTSSLLAKCGAYADEDVEVMEEWLRTTVNGVLVAHKPFKDLRAYVFRNENEPPIRVRFHNDGLVIAVADVRSFKIQDMRGAIREKRSDSLCNELAVNIKGWTVYGEAKESEP